MSTVDRSKLELLEQARDLLVEAMTADFTCPACEARIDVPAPMLPAVVRELRNTLTEIDRIPGSGEVSALDELADGLAIDLDAERRKRQAR